MANNCFHLAKTFLAMDQSNSAEQNLAKNIEEVEPKWDYTSSKQTFILGAVVLGLNALVVLAVVLDRTVPAVHTLLTGKVL